MGLCSDSTVTTAILIVPDRAVLIASQRSAFIVEVKKAVHEMLFEPFVVDKIATWTVITPSFTATVDMFVKKEVEKCSVVLIEMERWHQKWVKLIEESKIL